MLVIYVLAYLKWSFLLLMSNTWNQTSIGMIECYCLSSNMNKIATPPPGQIQIFGVFAWASKWADTEKSIHPSPFDLRELLLAVSGAWNTYAHSEIWVNAFLILRVEYVTYSSISGGGWEIVSNHTMDPSVPGGRQVGRVLVYFRVRIGHCSATQNTLSIYAYSCVRWWMTNGHDPRAVSIPFWWVGGTWVVNAVMRQALAGRIMARFAYPMSFSCSTIERVWTSICWTFVVWKERIARLVVIFSLCLSRCILSLTNDWFFVGAGACQLVRVRRRLGGGWLEKPKEV